ncbi:MAG: 3-hydroxyacyl-CoA dehydrogenase family protein, partial [Gemmatimonadota bacterium]
LERPENLCGMHFFNPVHRMPLVEVVRGAATSEEALATIFELTVRLGKTPVLVDDGPGFLVNRLLAPYLNEAGWLLADGASIEAVDDAVREFGMPMGPLRLLDEVGLDVARHAAAVLYDAFGDRLRPSPPLEALERTDRLGRKGGRGFYRYEDGREQEIDETVYDELGESVPKQRRELPVSEIVDRTTLVMVNEAARALDDGVVARAADVDVAMITGTGFPPFRGGLLRWADARGLGQIVDTLERLARDIDRRFEPAPLLHSLAERSARFYDDAAADDGGGGVRAAAAD